MAYSRKNKPLVKFDVSYYAHHSWVPNIQYLSLLHLDATERTNKSNWNRRVERFTNSEFGTLVGGSFRESNDTATLRAIINSQGVFSEKFFHRALRARVLRTYTRSATNRKQVENLLSAAAGYQYRITDKSTAIYFIIDHIYNSCIHELMQDTASAQLIDEWLDKHNAEKECALCDTKFQITHLPDWIYFGGNGYKHCCFSCLIVDRPIKKELLTLIPNFVEECEFIPNSAAGPIEYSFTSRIPHDRWERVIRAYASMGGVDHVKKKYGSWFTGLAETGALPEGVLTTARGIRCLSTDKHVCHSLDEQRIDNWLFERNIAHEREPIYPAHDEFNPSGRRRADWRVGDYYIEYFGLVGDSKYDKKLDEKTQLAELRGIELISLFPEDIECLDVKLGHLIQLSGYET